MVSSRLTDAELDAALEYMQALLSVRGTAIVAELRERRAAERQPLVDLSTAEHNARAALARDPKECVAITAEEACALFDRLAVAEGTLAIIKRDFNGPARPTHHRCQHCLIAAGIDERAWLCAEQFTDRALVEHLLTCHNDPSGVIIGALRDKQLELKRLLSVARAEVADIRRDRDERLVALADTDKRLDILRTAYEAMVVEVGVLRSVNASNELSIDRLIRECEERYQAHRDAQTMLEEVAAERDEQIMATVCERELWEIFADCRWEEVWARDAALEACQERIAGLLAERDKARAVADALASQNATLQATVLVLLAVMRPLDQAHIDVLRDMLDECERWMAHEEPISRYRAAALRAVLGVADV